MNIIQDYHSFKKREFVNFFCNLNVLQVEFYFFQIYKRQIKIESIDDLSDKQKFAISNHIDKIGLKRITRQLKFINKYKKEQNKLIMFNKADRPYIKYIFRK